MTLLSFMFYLDLVSRCVYSIVCPCTFCSVFWGIKNLVYLLGIFTNALGVNRRQFHFLLAVTNVFFFSCLCVCLCFGRGVVLFGVVVS